MKWQFFHIVMMAKFTMTAAKLSSDQVGDFIFLWPFLKT